MTHRDVSVSYLAACALDIRVNCLTVYARMMLHKVSELLHHCRPTSVGVVNENNSKSLKQINCIDQLACRPICEPASQSPKR